MPDLQIVGIEQFSDGEVSSAVTVRLSNGRCVIVECYDTGEAEGVSITVEGGGMEQQEFFVGEEEMVPRLATR